MSSDNVSLGLCINYSCRLGLDPKLLTKILNMSSGRCWSSDTYNPVPGVMEGVPSGNNYQGGFATALMTKVVGCSLIAVLNSLPWSLRVLF